MAVSATSAEQSKLLEIAAYDTKLIQLKHQSSTIPEIAQAHDLEVELGSIEMKIVAAETEIADLAVNQEKAESDVQQVELRISKDQARLNDSSTSPKELEGLQHELATLTSRHAELEDAELEVMQQLEDAKSALAGLTEDRNRVADQLLTAKSDLAAKLTELNAQIATQEKGRADTVSALPTELIDLYEKIRGDQGDVGAALLHRGSCQGCHIALDSTELNRIKSLNPDTVVRCEQCRRILVRTSESGL